MLSHESNDNKVTLSVLWFCYSLDIRWLVFINIRLISRAANGLHWTQGKTMAPSTNSPSSLINNSDQQNGLARVKGCHDSLSFFGENYTVQYMYMYFTTDQAWAWGPGQNAPPSTYPPPHWQCC